MAPGPAVAHPCYIAFRDCGIIVWLGETMRLLTDPFYLSPFPWSLRWSADVGLFVPSSKLKIRGRPCFPLPLQALGGGTEFLQLSDLPISLNLSSHWCGWYLWPFHFYCFYWRLFTCVLTDFIARGLILSFRAVQYDILYLITSWFIVHFGHQYFFVSVL